MAKTREMTRIQWLNAVSPFMGGIAQRHSLTLSHTSHESLQLTATNGKSAHIAENGIWFLDTEQIPAATLKRLYPMFCDPFSGKPCLLGSVTPSRQKCGRLRLECEIPIVPGDLDLVVGEISRLLLELPSLANISPAEDSPVEDPPEKLSPGWEWGLRLLTFLAIFAILKAVPSTLAGTIAGAMAVSIVIMLLQQLRSTLLLQQRR